MPAPNTIIGRVLGGYVIQSQIGSGGMGVVFKAHDDRLGRTVAIKVLPARYRADEVLKERFLREGRTAGRIDHPNVARILSAGEEGNLPYLVMEYVDGGSLQKLLEKRTKIPLKTALRIAGQVAEALAAAHKVGVLHRDVKPANVLFTKEGEAKLVDFGLAREEFSDVSLSQTGMVMGTPHYMSPEVCEGKKADARADVYALGVMLYAMLALRLPFDADTAMAILLAHIQKPVPPIEGLPKGVAAVLARSLAKKTSERWQGAGEFAAALAKVAEDPESVVSASVLTVAVPLPAIPTPGASPLAAGTTPTGVRAAPGQEPEATPTAGVAAARPGRPMALWAGIGAAVCVLAIAGTFAVVRMSRRDPSPPAPAPQTAPGPVVEAGSGTAETPPDTSKWEGALAAARETSKKLEEKDEFRQAMEIWNALEAPDTRAMAALGREKNELLNRASFRVTRETTTAARGASGARRLRELAAKMPPGSAAQLEEAAAGCERDWQPRDGLAALRVLCAGHDTSAAEAHVGALHIAGDEDHHALESAIQAIEHARFILERAGDWLEAHCRQSVTFLKTDGTRLDGRISAFDRKKGVVYFVMGTSQFELRAADVSASQLAAMAAEGCPPDDMVREQLDAVILMGRPGEAFPFALRARRRGIEIPEDRLRALLDDVPREELKASDALRKQLAKARNEGKPAASLSLEWLQRFGNVLLDRHENDLARQDLRRAGGPATATALKAMYAAEVETEGDTIRLRWNDVESLLADFQPLVRAAVAPGPDPGLRPERDRACLVLDGLDWSEGSIEAEVQTDGAMAIVTHWRSAYENLATTIEPAEDGQILVTLPMRSESFQVPKPQDGWLRITVKFEGGRMETACGGDRRECAVPPGWRGQAALFFTAPVRFRSLVARGKAALREPDLDAEFAPLAGVGPAGKTAPKESWQNWTGAGSVKGDRVKASADTEWTWLRPKSWTGGDNYRVAFGLNLSAKAEFVIGLRCGASKRVVLAGERGENGFCTGDRCLLAGTGVTIPRGTDVRVEVHVLGNLAAILVNGRSAWLGHLDGLEHGGVEFGLRRGTAWIGPMTVEELKQ